VDSLKQAKYLLLIILPLLVFLISPLASSATKVNYLNQNSKINKMNFTLSGQKKIISSTAKEISQLEKNLNIGNKRYLKTLRKRREIEISLYELQKKSLYFSDKLESKLKTIRTNLRGILINTLGNQDNPSELLARKLMIQNVLKEKKRYEEQLTLNKKYYQQVKVLDERIKEYKIIENELTTVLRNLEFKKRDKTDYYLSKVKQKDRLQSQLERVKIKYSKKGVNKKASIFHAIFKSPIDNFLGLEYKKKGVTFKYKGKMALKAAASGKIVYQGVLSNFGNVIMIDHGKQTRTILLGKFNAKHEKGDAVKAGQVVAYTRATGPKEEKLYFEVRKKNKVQNTFQLIDRNSLAKNN
jgi:septal ring factor EnvC (AmiA/AmiB activator)